MSRRLCGRIFAVLHLLEGIAEYQKRERRYGGLNHGDGHAAVETLLRFTEKALTTRGH